LYTASAITNAIEQIASNDKVNITDFFDETKKNVDVYNAMKTKIANDKRLSAYLQDPNLNPEDKQNMLQEIALSVMQELKYVPNDIKLMSTEETGRNNLPVMGYYDPDTQTSLINDINNNSIKDLLVSLGHEITHDMDNQDKKFISNDTNQNIYATNFGNNLAFYTDKALYIVDDKSLASTNNHNSGKVTEYPSIFNTDYIFKDNNHLFTKMDKSKGDDMPVLIPVVPYAVEGLIAVSTSLYAKYLIDKNKENIKDSLSTFPIYTDNTNLPPFDTDKENINNKLLITPKTTEENNIGGFEANPNTNRSNIGRMQGQEQNVENNIIYTDKQYKKSKSGSGKEKSNDIPSWAEGKRPLVGENGKDFAKRLLDERFGENNYKKGPSSDFDKIKKWGDRGFE